MYCTVLHRTVHLKKPEFSVVELWSYNQDIKFPFLNPLPTQDTGSPPTHRLPVSQPWPSSTQTFHSWARALWRSVRLARSLRQPHHSLGTRGCHRGGARRRQPDSRGQAKASAWRRHTYLRGRHGRRAGLTHRPCCIVWLLQPGYLYVSLLQRRKLDLLNPDVRGQTEGTRQNQSWRRQTGPEWHPTVSEQGTLSHKKTGRR